MSIEVTNTEKKPLKKIDKLIYLLISVNLILIAIVVGILNYFSFSNPSVLALSQFKPDSEFILDYDIEKIIPHINLETSTPTPTPEPTPIPPSFGLPVKLTIEKIAIDASIHGIGLTEAGSLDVPDSIQEVGWYQAGPRPGEWGNAIIDGHSGVSTAGVFRNLHQLSIGDIITITDDLGNNINFAVRELKTYPRDAQVPEIFTAKNTAHLNLITCDGVYIKERGGTLSRLVVFTDFVEQP